MNDVKLNHRDAIAIFQNDNSLTFLTPLSGGYPDHLFVIYEDAFGDAVSGFMHKQTIQETYFLDEKTIIEIFNKLGR